MKNRKIETYTQKIDNKLLSIKNLIKEANSEKNNVKLDLKHSISDNNKYIIENQKILKNLALNLEEEILNLSNLEKEYVEIAIKLAKDNNFRNFIINKIIKNKSKLFNDEKPIKFIEKFIKRNATSTIQKA